MEKSGWEGTINMNSIFKLELKYIRDNYQNSPLHNIKPPHLDWMFMNDEGEDELDEMVCIYDDISTLTKEGQIYYAVFVAANNILYKRFPRWDAPAYIVFSLDSFVNEHPDILEDAADEIFSYVGHYENAPSNLRIPAEAVTDEYIRALNTPFKYYSEEYRQEFSLYFTSIAVFRKDLPKKRITGRLMPILALPSKCKSTFILPKEYWTKSFTKNFW